MGVEYYLIDDEGKNALDCHKWYGVSAADDDNITDAEIAACTRFDWLPACAIRWRGEVCGGRKLRLVTDLYDLPWEDYDGNALPGWTLYTPWYGYADAPPPPDGWVKYPSGVAEEQP